MKMLRFITVLLILSCSRESNAGINAPDVSCTSDKDCQSVANSACFSGLCKCVFTYIRNVGTGVCEKPSNTGYCTSHYDCGFGTCDTSKAPYICVCEGTYQQESNCRLKACGGGLSTRPLVTSLVLPIVVVLLVKDCAW
ncbi:uncharacterized protein LOC125671294 isoform X2 [Ostrea edulis]|uniref:uncharacterized protein LOC125671294 isoform X2 n=1 Tax=Ostrea edulis TaxID=37623 RepID=UPI0024AF1919|nr:uncharacterized protein LOC125671294 isoform X2 [Ostrea edulis]